MWAVTDVSIVPPGALVLHPQTGRPLTNPDGSIYHFDPANPPLFYDPVMVENDKQQVEQKNDKRRGRLEKQHSFIDHEAEQVEACHDKCCCECRRRDTCTQHGTGDNKERITPSHTLTNSQNPMPNTPSPTPQNHKTLQQNTSADQEVAIQRAEEKTTNERPFENQINNVANQKPFEKQIEGVVNQIPFEIQKNQELASQRASNEFIKTNDAHELQSYHQQYTHPQPYRVEEITSPHRHVQTHIPHQDSMQMMQNKLTPVGAAQPDPNIRPVSLSSAGGVLYGGAPTHPHYPYQIRVDQSMVYQPMVQTDEHKLNQASHSNETTFRIDPSYPYAGVDYAGACGACVDTNVLQHQPRSYSVPYSQVEVPQMVPGPYAVGNVLVPQPHLQAYPYQETMGWPQVAAPAKLMVPDVYPAMVPYPQPAYSHYNIMYPQMIPQTYPVCQSIYPIIEPKPPERRNSIPNARIKHNAISNSSRNTPDKAMYDEQARQAEIAAKIQQIKSQMAQLDVKDNKRPEKVERQDWKEGRRRNSGNGILGNCPANNYNGRVRSQEEAHLTSAARAIVNSIRNMQAKTNNTYQDQRWEHQRFDPKERPRRQERDDRDRPPPPGQDRYDVRSRGVNVPVYRQPYLYRQMSPGTWCRRSPGSVHPVLNPPRRQHPDGRNQRR